ncbi:hypothetical protein PV08_01222 [Exophiala spinifera]|uniref:Uncharacterized protein n=1 Tax=Exophiala spinifera TaxID=91928 RepID=A0A0D2BQ68_9EURO|nr:uncharacterized protein PV08_01222 [Exophiala spinifera]KIW20645.1 hypothetical protein PV08_01222 [Exophiala spinifera]
MPSCLGNTTDCLLGELVDQGRGFQWDPLNFAFTAILSILALFVATLALLQGVLAAGPGRLKASQNVIGFVYGQSARTRFDWTEWRFRTTVQVPIIDLPQIISASRKWDSESHIERNASLQRRARKFLSRIFMRSSSRCHPATHSRDVEALPREEQSDAEDVSASWTMLLRHVGLEPIKLRTRLCKTDHLPADVPAAPAFATIEALMVLAVLAGCTSCYVRQDLPLAKGPQVQIVLRQHPSLGLVGIYQSYKERSESENLPLEQTRWACLEALGHVRFHQQPFLEIRCLPKNQIDVRTNLTALLNIIDHQDQCDHEICTERVKSLRLSPQLLMRHNSYSQLMLLVLLFADRPRASTLFPLRLFRYYEDVHLSIKSSPSWSAEPLNVIEALKLLPLDEKSLLLFRYHPSRRDVAVDRRHSKVEDYHFRPNETNIGMQPLIDDHFAGTTQQTWFGPAVSLGQSAPLRAFPLSPPQPSATTATHPPQLFSATDGDLLVSADALELCFQWRSGAQYLNNLTLPERMEARKWLAWQLATVDSWLREHGSEDSFCATMNLLARLYITTRDTLKVHDGPSRPLLAILDGEEAGDQTPAERVEHNLRGHLAIRDDFVGELYTNGEERRLTDDEGTHTESPGQPLLEWYPGKREGDSEEDIPLRTFASNEGDPSPNYSREPREDEEYVMSRFAKHLKRCRHCPDLHEMHLQSGSGLCKRGLVYARRVARYVYPINGKPYSVIDKRNGNDVELILSGAVSDAIQSLLFAFEHGLWLEIFRQDEDDEPSSPQPRTHFDDTGRRSSRGRGRETSIPPLDEARARRSQSRERVRPILRPKSRLEAMETLLLFRAVLYAALASTAMDSSDILEMKDRDEIVQVL